MSVSGGFFALITVILCFICSCGQAVTQEANVAKDEVEGVDAAKVLVEIIDREGQTIETRINTPAGFIRLEAGENSFVEYLRTLPLKPHGAKVKYFDGSEKANFDVYDAVVDLPIGKKDLHQCADAVMRLRAEYFYKLKQYDKIHFNFTNGFRVDYTKWMEGNRIVVNGNNTTWRHSAAPSVSAEDFWKYLEIIFTYAGTLSLDKELQSVDVDDLEIGDVFIRGGSPGHAVIVVDAAVNTETNEKIFLLAQSYMPAQELHLLKNRNDADLSPWYSVYFGETLITPEWSFNRTQLKKFR